MADRKLTKALYANFTLFFTRFSVVNFPSTISGSSITGIENSRIENWHIENDENEARNRFQFHKARYTLFVFIRKQWQKNLNFAKRGKNTPTHCSSSTAVFANMNISFRATKNRLWVSSRNRSIERRWHRTHNKNPVCETSAKMLYTLFVFCSFFVISLIFCYCSR